MNNDAKIICDQLAKEAGFDKEEFLTEQEREITQAELEALAAAYAEKLDFYNWHFHAQIKQPGHPKCLSKVWTTTIGKWWGLQLRRRARNMELVYLIHAGAK